MSKPSAAFSAAYAGTVGAIGVQLAREPMFAGRLSGSAAAFVTAVALALTGASQAHAENTVKRAAIDTFAGIAGAAVGSQFGGGNGKKMATAAGAAAGVWIAESMQEDSRGSQRGTYNDGSASSFGPTGWSNSSTQNMQPIRQSARQVARIQGDSGQVGRWSNAQVPGMSQAAARVGLMSGTTALNGDRLYKLKSLEGAFLRTRDNYAKALFAAEQAQDDAVLDRGSRDASRASNKAMERVVEVQQAYGAARSIFVEAVEHLGERGYNVVAFSYSHRIAAARVTSDDMPRGALSSYIGRESRDDDVSNDRGVANTLH